MNQISIYVLTLCLSFACISLHSQNNRARIITTNELNDNIFYHTIERGQTVYSIATMYGVTVDDIYHLNPESRESIKAGATLKIPQKDVSSAPMGNAEDNYLYHTIQPKETLYSLSIRYKVPGPDIIAANPGLSVSTFTIGKTIRIPATPIETLPTKEVKTVTKEIEYTIAKKETMYRICRKFNVSSAELIKRNPELKNGVKAGMVIKIPVETKETVTETAPAMHERDVNALLSIPQEIKRVNMIKVALLLPFMTNEATPSANTLRFIEYYEGMLLAVDSLRNSGCSIELSVFDTGNGTKKVKEILKEDALKEANLIVGAVQIIFGMFLKVANQWKQHGFAAALSTIGWLVLILGEGICYWLSTKGYAMDVPMYVVGAVAGLLIFVFNNVRRNVFINIGAGLWDSYNMVTGLLGDTLSYIRLFALGISSAVLGLVFNDLAMNMSPDVPGVKQLVMLIILLFGHSVNLFMAGLGSFVHPMRLTFVEFYKNAGFEGGGKKYQPYKKRSN